MLNFSSYFNNYVLSYFSPEPFLCLGPLCESCSVMSDSLWHHGLYSPWNYLGQNTGVGSLILLQGTFPTQGSNLGLPYYRQILYQLNHKGSPRIMEWIAYLFSRGSSQHRNRTGVSCIAGEFFTNWAIREESILYSLWNSSGQNTRVGSLSLLQGIFPTQRSNPGLPHCRWILYQLSHKGSPFTWGTV